MVETILSAIVGAATAIIFNWVKAWIDRETATSNELLKQRIKALNDIWLCFIKAKNTYVHKFEMGHAKWLKEYRNEAQKDIDAFREEIDKNQIILPCEIVEVLREIDIYLFDVLGLDDQKFSDYKKDIDKLLNNLSEKTNAVLGKRTHAINLKFRT
uniref:hypothetical protein n=1 Tax=Candidatus Electronema sp. TaxID=2698783 RepID=UPI0040565975